MGSPLKRASFFVLFYAKKRAFQKEALYFFCFITKNYSAASSATSSATSGASSKSCVCSTISVSG